MTRPPVGCWWNYKSAVLSALSRGLIFFLVNLGAGREAAVAAMVAEWAFRLSTAGFYGALTQAASGARSPAVRRVMAFLVIPAVTHSLEFALHTWRGTPAVGASVTASAGFTMLSTAFHMFAMRRGVLLAGGAARPLLDDLRALPRMIGLFIAASLGRADASCSRRS